MPREPIRSFEDPVDEPRHNPYAGRVWFFRAVILILFLAFGVQLYRLQIIEGHKYRESADNNRYRLARIDPTRGVMYDRNGILLVRNMPSYAVAVVPADLPDNPQPVYQKLAFILGKPQSEISDQCTAAPKGKRQTDPFTPVIIETNVSQEVAFLLEERHVEMPGVMVQAQSYREYLDGKLTSHIIGYVGRVSEEQYETLKTDTVLKYQADDRVGQTGLESTYEAVLRGKVGEKQMEVDSSGREVRTLAVSQATAGSNIRLTMDLALQREIARIASENIDKYKSVTIMAMDPSTGQILAMVSVPTYDNNLFSRKINSADFEKLVSDPARPLVNHAIADVYPPGSTFKIVTAAGALQEGVVAASTTVDCENVIYVQSEYANTRFVCWGTHHEQDIVSGLANSCDIYFYNLGGGPPDGSWQGLGVDRLGQWASLFGLGQPTGIDLPGESSGNVPTAAWKKQNWSQDWFLGDTYNMSIGQGFVTATPIQILNMFSAAINGGTLLQPQLVQEVIDSDGNTVQSFAPRVIRNIPVNSTILEYIRQGLRANMEPDGTSPWGTKYTGTAYTADVPGLRIGGKTGTAEFGTPDANGKMPTHGWFVGAAPIENPKIAVLAFVEYGSGSLDAAELVEQVMRYYFRVPS